jgi:cell shape-determining protein MreC
MSDVLARLMRWMETSDTADADVVLRNAITEIAGLRARLDELRSENARLRGLCGLAPKQPIPDLRS